MGKLTVKQKKYWLYLNDMAEKQKKWDRMNEKFERNEWTGSRKLSAVGCFMRHETPRNEQLLTQRESAVREFSIMRKNCYEEYDISPEMSNLEKTLILNRSER